MTKRQREQVVELLRCAADLYGIGRARDWLGLQSFGLTWFVAKGAWESVADEYSKQPNGLAGWTYPLVCLEAAARVEEGSWP